MAEAADPKTLTFHGERVSWVSPASLEELIQLKTSNPGAPLVVGNTNIGQFMRGEEALGLSGQRAFLCVVTERVLRIKFCSILMVCVVFKVQT